MAAVRGACSLRHGGYCPPRESEADADLKPAPAAEHSVVTARKAAAMANSILFITTLGASLCVGMSHVVRTVI
jgi:hypothetical protein